MDSVSENAALPPAAEPAALRSDRRHGIDPKAAAGGEAISLHAFLYIQSLILHTKQIGWHGKINGCTARGCTKGTSGGPRTLHSRTRDVAAQLALDVKVILTPPCTFT